ncbi:MAG: hypothetical protein ACOC84_00865 [Actinomycetota bacterium]
MTTYYKPIPLADLRVGDQVQAWSGAMLHYVGIVELVSLRLKVVWIRDLGLGERRMLDLQDYQLRYRDPRDTEQCFW